MEATSLGMIVFLAVDIVASIALAIWLGVNVGGGSDWDRRAG